MGTTPNASANPKNRYPRPPLPKTIMRWHCGEKIPLPTEQETCPLCGATLTKPSYDEAAGIHRR